MNRTYLFIDGTNLFAGQRELFGPKDQLDFQAFLKQINKIVKIDKILFYASYSGLKQKDRFTRKFLTEEAIFYRQVKNTKGLYFYKGHRSPTSGKEKGVDVHLAVDIVKGIFLKEYQQVIIITGDADLIYPLEIAKSLGCKTGAIFIPNRFSLEISYKVDWSIILNYQSAFRFGKARLSKRLKVVSLKSPVCLHTG